MDAVLPLSCVDSLGAGALLAMPSARYRTMAAGFLIGVPLTLAALAFRAAGHVSQPFEVALDLGVSLAAAWVIGRAAKGFTGWMGAFLSARPVIYTGTISYGLYVYHGFMPYVLGRYVTGFASMPSMTRFALLTTATFAAAAASWHCFEAPILTLKDRVSNPRSARADHRIAGYEAA
jgi:peptidoglycan/LPS O-acetylase OafA/YrhL